MSSDRERSRQWYLANKERHAARRAEWDAANPEKRIKADRKAHLRKKYNLSLDQFDNMVLAQGGVCAICGNTCELHTNLSVDHCHESGVVRGLLCARCNKGLGHFMDDPDILKAAISYLEHVCL